MTKRHVHYEAGFEDFLRSRGWPYVPVEEQRRIIFSGCRVKSFDFLVYHPGAVTWLVDVKGRKFPYEVGGSKRYWDNWVTREDLEGLKRWQETFGEGFTGMLVFAYWLGGNTDRWPSTSVHCFRNESYCYLSVPVATYTMHARPRSAKWDTLSMPTKAFREMAQPLG